MPNQPTPASDAARQDATEVVAKDPLSIRLDWVSYYAKFKEVHGEPIRWRGRLIFPDGWQYSATDVQGPEWPPPDDDELLLEQMRAYWTTRLIMVRAERDVLRSAVREIKSLQSAKSAPLQHQVLLESESEDGTLSRSLVRTDVDVGSIESGRLAWLEQDVADCEAEATKLFPKEAEVSDGL